METDLINNISKKIIKFEEERIKRLSILVFREIMVFLVLFFLIKCFIICINDPDASLDRKSVV